MAGIDITDAVSGGGGGKQDLQSVTTFGNTSSNPIYVSGIGFFVLSINADYVALDTDYLLLCDISAANIRINLPDIKGQVYCIKIVKTASTRIATLLSTGGTIDGAVSYIVSVLNECVMVQGIGSKKYIVISANVRMDGGTFTNAAFTGNSIGISHNLGVAPKWITITSSNAATAAVLAGGYSVVGSSFSLVVILNVPVGVAISLSVNWGVYWKQP